MNFNEYQEEATKSAIYGSGDKVTYPVLGLASEAGEVADKVKKVLRDHNGEWTQSTIYDLKKELGDVLWYIAAIANDMKMSLEDIAICNIAKLHSRRERNVIHGSGDNR